MLETFKKTLISIIISFTLVLSVNAEADTINESIPQNNDTTQSQILLNEPIEKEKINEFEITNASININAGTNPVFTGKSVSEKYIIEESWTNIEQNENGDTITITATSNVSKNEINKASETLLETFEEGKNYIYSILIKIKKEYNELIDESENYKDITINGDKYQASNIKISKLDDGTIDILFENIINIYLPKTLQETDVTLNKDEYTYNGQEIKPLVEVVNNDEKLIENKDYKISYENNINVGEATVLVEGINKYKGTIKKTYKIIRKKIEYNVSKTNEVIYNGKEQKPKPIVKDNEKELIINKDYKVKYENNINSGEATIVIEGIGNYQGKYISHFTITKKDSIIPEETKTTKRIVEGSSLSNIILKTNGLKWVNKDTKIKKGTYNYQAIYIQNNDSTNYNPTIVDIKIKGLSKIKINVINEDGHGTINASRYVAIEGELVTFTFTPDEGYRTKSIKINDNPIIISSNKFNYIAQDIDVNLKVKFSLIEHDIMINGTKYVDIDIPEVSKVNHFENKEIMMISKKGYRIYSIRVNNIEKINDLKNNVLQISNIISDINIDILTEPIIYRFIEGAGQSYHPNDKEPLKFSINANYKKFEKLYIDNKLVDSSYYTITDDRTTITINQNYLSKISYGTHTIKAIFSDGGEAKTNFVLSSKEIQNPNTVDRILSYVVVLIICLAIVLIVVYKKNNED